MSNDLFQIEETLSPRLVWMKKHGVLSYYHLPTSFGEAPIWMVGFQNWWPGESGVDFFAKETGENGDSRIGEGDTVEEALVNLAVRWEIPHWNQEPSTTHTQSQNRD